MTRRFNKIAVLKGGISSEREVSLRSGTAIAQGLRDGGYDVVEIDLQSRTFELPAEAEAVFIALHGTFGEDGEVQQMLEDRQIPYTGSSADSCRISFDKVLTRNRLEADGIPVPPGEVLGASDARSRAVPLVVKPPREGSSVGCHLVFEEQDWGAAFEDALRYSPDVLVEEYIPGRELTVGVVDGMVLPVVEIIPEAQWYDYKAKYGSGDTQYVVPAELDTETVNMLQSIALKTVESLGASGFSRVDFRLNPEGQAYVLELNSIPGFTATSLLPKAAEAAGIGFSELCCRIVELAHL